MYVAKFEKLSLKFKRPSGTSRGILTEKESWILKLWNKDQPGIVGQGEASIIKTLSPDWPLDYLKQLDKVSQNINHYIENIGELNAYPSIQMAIETAKADLMTGGHYQIFDLPAPQSENRIPINGLIWMGDKVYMLEQIEAKLKAGFSCIKLKIGAIDFQTELDILAHIRSNYSKEEIELRVDANGAFKPDEAMDKLRALAQHDLHSIEQPIRQKQIEDMARLCRTTPVPIALDEELIGITDMENKARLLEEINPQYIILKPSLIGGFHGTDEWIELAEQQNIKWWVTSALESNIGLNAIAQYTLTKNNPLPQGLGTGSLYTNNVSPFLEIVNGELIV